MSGNILPIQDHLSETTAVHPSSFRDPSGYVFWKNGCLYRKIAKSGEKNWDDLVNSNFLSVLIDKELLIPHETIERYLIKPKVVPLVSYPQEWSFSQYKDAALLTLEVAQTALQHDFILKDASAYNVQFIGHSPIFIDTLSFERLDPTRPWVAYKQFCQHFLAPLMLMAKVDVALSKLMSVYIDGIPLDLASKILPFSSRFSLSAYLHIHLHARSQQKYADIAAKTTEASKVVAAKFDKKKLEVLLDGLKSAVSALKWKPAGTEWGDYYSATNYSNEAMSEKGKLVGEFVRKSSAKVVWDLGANTGVFSHIAAQHAKEVVSFDIDPAAVENHYLYLKNSASHKSLPVNTKILPLVLDLTNPTSDYGWAGSERQSVKSRANADLVMALALIHHLAISNNIPLERIAKYFRDLSSDLIIEFVPKSDSQVKKLLATREDIFPDYTIEGFEKAFSRFFEIIERKPVTGSERVLYLLQGKRLNSN